MSDTDFWIKQGDTSPGIEATLEDDSGSAVDLSNATAVEFHMMDMDGNVQLDTSAQFEDKANGKVKYAWSAGDTDTAGLFEAEWEISWTDGSTESYPNHENLVLKITPEIA